MNEGKRINREKRTVQAMLEIYCKQHHKSEDTLCPECRELQDYAFARLSHCKFGEEKPTCGKCPVHCYKPGKRQQIIAVMKYSGPKMVYHHPVIAVRHLLDGRVAK